MGWIDRFRGAAILVAAGLSAAEAAAQTPIDRVAIVVGNADYATLPDLRNARSDAERVARFLTESGYVVLEALDVSKSDFDALIEAINTDVPYGAEVIFYYAGHGFQVGSQNYIVPTDSAIRGRNDIPFEAISMENLIAVIGAKASLQMFFLDSCREDPFVNTEVALGASGQTRRIEAGFSFQRAPINSLISFSTSPGAVAYDGTDGNSPYTSALLDVARLSPREEIASILTRVRQRVYAQTEGKQVPWESSSLVRPVYFSPPDAPVSPAPEPEPAPPPVPSGRIAEAITLNGRFDRFLDLGDQLASLARDRGAAEIEVVAVPKSGTLTVVRATRGIELVPGLVHIPLREGDRISIDELATLEYSPKLRDWEVPAAQTDGRQDNFAFRIAEAEQEVRLRMTLDPCDVAAGGVLDPQGIGIEVYNQDLDPDEALKSCMAAVAEHPETARFHYQLARALKANNRTAEAERELEIAIGQGHRRATTALAALKYQSARASGGFYREEASEEVLRMYAEGVRSGDPQAAYGLGRQLVRHGETEEVRERGYQLLLQAFEAGYAQALNELGSLHMADGGRYRDPARGLRYFEEAAARDNAYGEANLGIVYLQGLGGYARDLPKAEAYLRAASEKGHPVAPTLVGRILAGQYGTAPDYDAAIRWFDLGLSRGDPWGGVNGAIIAYNEHAGGLGPFDAAARAAKAATFSDPKAAEAARTVLSKLPAKALDGGAQELLNELGAALVIDGQFGRASETAYRELVEPAGESSGNPGLDRLLAVAKTYHEKQRFRIDQF